MSDNTAYNYLYDFIGRDSINSSLLQRGIHDIQILHRFSYSDTYHKTPGFKFYNNEGDIVYEQNSILSKQRIISQTLKGCIKGTGYIKEDSLIKTNGFFAKELCFITCSERNCETNHFSRDLSR